MAGKKAHVVPKKDTTTPTTTPAPKPTEPSTPVHDHPKITTVGRPTGTIPTSLKIAYGRGYPWSNVTIDAPYHEKYAARWGLDPAVLMAMEVIEAGGKMIWNAGGSGAYGIMQIKAANWGWLADELGVDLNTREGQIAVAAAIIGHYGAGDTWQERFLNSYYPVMKDGKICLTCKGEDGGTPQQYLDDIAKLVKIIHEAGEGVEPVEVPEPVGDVIDLLFGGKGYTISAYYGQKITWNCPLNVPPGGPGNCYEYQEAYGLDDTHHYAYDVSANAGDGAPLYAPFDGLVVCAGTGIGSGAWGTGCAANNRLNNYGSPYPNGIGAGRLELLNEAGTASLIIGHVLASKVSAGTRVKRGDLIGQQGGMNGSHVHLEGRTKDGKIGDPRKLFPGGPITVPVERLPYDLNIENNPNLFTVKAVKNVKVYQRADPKAIVIDAIPAGDTFQAKAIVPGNDKKQWWLGARDGRVPMDGTELIS